MQSSHHQAAFGDVTDDVFARFAEAQRATQARAHERIQALEREVLAVAEARMHGLIDGV